MVKSKRKHFYLSRKIQNKNLLAWTKPIRTPKYWEGLGRVVKDNKWNQKVVATSYLRNLKWKFLLFARLQILHKVFALSSSIKKIIKKISRRPAVYDFISALSCHDSHTIYEKRFWMTLWQFPLRWCRERKHYNAWNFSTKGFLLRQPLSG